MVCFFSSGFIIGILTLLIKIKLKPKLPPSELIIKPGIAALAMAVVLYFITPLLSGCGKLIACMVPIGVGAVIYLAFIVLMKGIS